MTEKDFQDRLNVLMNKIADLPEADREKLENLADETRDRHGRMKKTIGELQESLDYLRLSVKYLVFDLEATRRENKYLRQLIDTRATDEAADPNQDHDNDPGFDPGFDPGNPDLD
ncbi:MAG: hypothetical protein AAFP26_08370 [Planctomycetota bacterium]